MPLRSMMGARAFAKWGMDFVGPIHPATMHTHAEYIIVAIDYVTKWVEAKATIKNDARTTAKFLYEHVFTRYDLPIEIVSDRGTHFLNEVIEHVLKELMVVHKKSTPYHPQANGHAESTNKILCTVLTKIVSQTKTDWEQKLHGYIMGISSVLQNHDWHHAIQHNFRSRCHFANVIPNPNSARSKRFRMDGTQTVRTNR